MPNSRVSLITLSLLLFIGAGCSSASQQNPSTATPPSPEEKNIVSGLNFEVNIKTPEGKEGVTVTPVSPPTAQKQKTTPPPTEQKPAASQVKEFTMTAKNWDFEPSNISVKKGDKVRLHIKSVDVDHGFTLAAFGVSTTLKPGETKTVEFVADKVGNHSFFCSVFCGAGHKEMRGTLTVTE